MPCVLPLAAYGPNSFTETTPAPGFCFRRTGASSAAVVRLYGYDALAVVLVLRAVSFTFQSVLSLGDSMISKRPSKNVTFARSTGGPMLPSLVSQSEWN